jgi:uncharacterized protein YjiS (DUF1127 family)
LHRTITAYIPNSESGACRTKGFRTMLLSIIRYLQSWKRYGLAVQELSQLNDRELADIGITRSDIPRIAWEHADYDCRASRAAHAALPGGAVPTRH